MKRRDFLKKSSVAGAAIAIPTLVPSNVLGLNGATPPSDKLVMAAIGLGGMGKGNMNALMKTGKTHFIATCDLEEGRREGAKNALRNYYQDKEAKAYESVDKLLRKHKNLDAVTIAVPDHWHALLYTQCANAGLHIYGEKPLTRTVWEGQEVVKAVKRNNITWQTGSWQRSTKHFHKAASIIRDGVLGQLERVEVGLPDFNKSIGMPDIVKPPSTIDYDEWVGPAEFTKHRGIIHWDWRWIQKYSAGQLSDWGAHHIDIALWSLGLDHTGPKEIKGKATFNSGDLFDVAHTFDIDYVLDNDLPMRVANKSQTEKGQGVYWVGEKGWIFVNRKELIASDPSLLNHVVKGEGLKLKNTGGDHRLDFVDCVHSGELPVAHIEVAHRANSFSLLGEIAIMTGEKLKWDYRKEKFIGASAKATAMLKRDYRKPYKIKY